MAISFAGEQAFSNGWDVVNSRRANLNSSSVNDILFFKSAFKPKNKALKVDQKVSHICFTVFFKSFCWLWSEPLNKLPQTMKHVALVFRGF